MCGFTCVVTRKIPLNNDKGFIPKDTLEHRGPDATKEILHNNVRIRHWRLSIVDLTSHSDQPIENDNEIFVYNGELYDYKSIGLKYNIADEGDTRVVLDLIDSKGGLVELQESAGFYAFLRYLKNENIIHGSRDRVGKKSLFYYVDNDVAVFSSEERGILPFIPKMEVNSKVIGEYFLYKSRFYGQTFFKGVYEIPPGASFEFDINDWNLNISHDWNWYYKNDLANWYKKTNVKSFPVLFKEAVKRRIKCDVPVQIALSGGVDSTAMAAIAITNSSNISKGITIGFEQGLDESKRAKETASLLKLPHDVVTYKKNMFYDLLRDSVLYMSAPLDHPHALTYNLMCQNVKKNGKVLLTGEGADELFYGYEHYKCKENKSFAFREYLNNSDEHCFISSNGNSPFDNIRSNAKIEEFRKLSLSSSYASRDMELKTHLLSLLQRNDKMGMRSSIEIRSPFLDQSIISMSLSLKNSKCSGNKSEIEDIAFDLINDLPKFPIKNGFRVPFDEHYEFLIKDPKVKKLFNLGVSELKKNLGIELKIDTDISPRLGWSIINIGCFISIFKEVGNE
jgi:asparagine synthase (glutamine-hydrolysing)